MATFFTSDHHYGHRMVAGLRGFEVTDDDVRAHDNVLDHNYREIVGKDDLVYFLGDLTLQGSTRIAYALDRVAQLPGTKVFISGNHDMVHPGIERKESRKYLRRYMDVFDGVFQFMRVKVFGTDVLLSHFPYQGDHGHDRYVEYRLQDTGIPLLHGHTHKADVISHTDKGTLQYHVGLDAHGLFPVLAERVLEAINDFG